MYHYMKGMLVKQEIDRIILENGGIGYDILTTSRSVQEFEENKEIKVFTRLVVKEEEMILIGFSSLIELEIFDFLRTVSGVGIKSALSILNTLDLSGLIQSIIDEDYKPLTAVSGIGKKTAQRIIIDLKDKFAKHYAYEKDAGLSEVTLRSSEIGGSGKKTDVRDALMSLGYKSAEINHVYRDLDWDHLEVEELIRESLKLLMKA